MSGALRSVINSLIVAVAGVLLSAARDDSHHVASTIVDCRMPTKVRIEIDHCNTTLTCALNGTLSPAAVGVRRAGRLCPPGVRLCR